MNVPQPKIFKKAYLSFEKRYFFLSLPSKGVHRQLPLTKVVGGPVEERGRVGGEGGVATGFFFSFSVGESKLNVPKVVLYATYRVLKIFMIMLLEAHDAN